MKLHPYIKLTNKQLFELYILDCISYLILTQLGAINEVVLASEPEWQDIEPGLDALCDLEEKLDSKELAKLNLEDTRKFIR